MRNNEMTMVKKLSIYAAGGRLPYRHGPVALAEGEYFLRETATPIIVAGWREMVQSAEEEAYDITEAQASASGGAEHKSTLQSQRNQW
jgi:hypothetical protein